VGSKILVTIWKKFPLLPGQGIRDMPPRSSRQSTVLSWRYLLVCDEPVPKSEARVTSIAKLRQIIKIEVGLVGWRGFIFRMVDVNEGIFCEIY
jgi:hypothetical protein